MGLFLGLRKSKHFSVILHVQELLISLSEKVYLFNNQKADDKIFVCKFSKNVKSKLYYIENSKTRGQTV